ncbi:enoyl-CoA hydratase/isomerase family protein [Haliea sp. E17]|uniref:enoyl-CoA hydratase/isomerase family protein n=1 Tax=Haliea sp. E17 TaxID=3401576 RepID=UPI003AACD005
MSESVLYQREGYVGTIVLNKPERHNSLGRIELDELHKILDQVESDNDVRMLVVTGRGDKTFCAGASLQDLRDGLIQGDDFQAVTDRIGSLRMPTLAALGGNAFGGGVELALSCDFRMGVTGIRMRVPAARIGLCYPVNGIQRFVEKLGMNVAKRVLMAAEEFDTQGMKDIGFLSMVVEPSQLQPEVERFSASVAALAPMAVAAMKAIIQQSGRGQLDMATASDLVATCAGSNDLREGLLAQKEKREPEFSGQ